MGRMVVLEIVGTPVKDNCAAERFRCNGAETVSSSQREKKLNNFMKISKSVLKEVAKLNIIKHYFKIQ